MFEAIKSGKRKQVNTGKVGRMLLNQELTILCWFSAYKLFGIMNKK